MNRIKKTHACVRERVCGMNEELKLKETAQNWHYMSMQGNDKNLMRWKVKLHIVDL